MISQRDETYAALTRQAPVLSDRVRAAQDAVRQAEAALASARATAAQPKTGDVVAARADAEARKSDWLYASDQAARLELRRRSPASSSRLRAKPATPRALAARRCGDDRPSVGDHGRQRKLLARTKVDEQDVASVNVGQRAEIGGEDLERRSCPGTSRPQRVAQKSDDPSNTSRQVITTVQLDRSLPYLRDGMTVDVDIITREAPHVLVVATMRSGATTATSPTCSWSGTPHGSHAGDARDANETQTIVKRGSSRRRRGQRSERCHWRRCGRHGAGGSVTSPHASSPAP